MKKLLLILLCLPMIFSCGDKKKEKDKGYLSKEIENDLTKKNIKGKVKEITETSFDAKKTFFWTQKDSLISHTKRKYDKNGQVYWMNDEYYNFQSRKQWINKYDEDGNVLEVDYGILGASISKMKYKYDEDGKKIRSLSYDLQGELVSKWKYKYDEDGNKTEEHYNADGDLTGKRKYKYDEDGNETEESHYNADGELQRMWKSQYDEDGNKTEWGLISYSSSLKNGAIVKGGELVLQRKYKYQYDEFDKLNNWIVRTEKEINEINPARNKITICEREIEYYELEEKIE